MGLFRFFLALQVVLTHSRYPNGHNLIPGDMAVESFYMISGFYMALVLNEKYLGKGSYKLFITNRFLRLAPVYWAALILTIVFQPAYMTLWAHFFWSFHITTQIYLVFTSLFIFGQDILSFLRFNPHNGMMELARTFNDSIPGIMPPSWMFLIIRPSWTLGLELNFYLIAPFILRRKVWLIASLLAMSLILRVLLFHYHYGSIDSSFRFRFFPTELAFFFTGALLYRIYRNLDKIKLFCNKMAWGKILYPKLPYVAIFVLCVASLSFKFFPQYMLNNSIDKRWFYFLFISWTIPFIFKLTKRSKIDRFIGELSYPIYLIHWVVLNTFLLPIIKKSSSSAEWFNTLEVIYILIVILLSAGIVVIIEKPFEAYRQKRFERARQR